MRVSTTVELRENDILQDEPSNFRKMLTWVEFCWKIFM